jgi:hypothetical protein
VILSSLKSLDRCEEGDIYKPCKWTIPDLEERDMRGKVTCVATDNCGLLQLILHVILESWLGSSQLLCCLCIRFWGDLKGERIIRTRSCVKHLKEARGQRIYDRVTGRVSHFLVGWWRGRRKLYKAVGRRDVVCGSA